VSVGQYFTCDAEAFPPVTMIVLYVNDTLISNGSQTQNYTLESVGDYNIRCIAFNYIYETSNSPCNGTASVSGTATKAGMYQHNNSIICIEVLNSSVYCLKFSLRNCASIGSSQLHKHSCVAVTRTTEKVGQSRKLSPWLLLQKY
jgi:hypothetical protein